MTAMADGKLRTKRSKPPQPRRDGILGFGSTFGVYCETVSSGDAEVVRPYSQQGGAESRVVTYAVATSVTTSDGQIPTLEPDL
jgi:hypothetical protein